MELKDEQQILKLFEDGDRALIAADMGELFRIFADDYVQYDESGKAFTRQNVIDNLRTGKIRYVSMVSTSRRIRLFRDFAIVHGTEVDTIEQTGERVAVRYVYMDVVVKRDGRWQIAGSQLAKPLKGNPPPANDED
jgi:ketosteroid isomerase-like protein